MKSLICTLFILAISLTGFAQGIITGKATDENNKALPGAHIVLEETGDVGIADAMGYFRINNVEPGTYTIKVSFIGYETISQTVEVSKTSRTYIEVKLKPGNINLSDLVVSSSAQQPFNTLTPVDIQLRPTNTSQDILRIIPGLFIAQHAGGGKAEQIFLRGFDIDHGTDLNLEVDGLPVNMVSHAHGQGYADLHFIVPEFINYVDFNKGPYYADKGDFTTAGFVDFQTKNVLDENFAKVEGGQFGTFRTVAGVNLFSQSNEHTTGYIGTEFFRTDGFVESPQDFNRLNIVTKISRRSNNDNFSAGASYFTSKWDASGQIPNRGVTTGLITRFGSIDDTEGGETNRFNIFLKHNHQFENGAYFNHQAYAIHYGFDLFSNFTFYLTDPENGDQIQQKESRMIYGYKANYSTTRQFLGKEIITDVGAGVRLDDVDDVSLSRSVRRKFLNYEQRGDVRETNINGFIDETLILSDQWSVNAALRFDYLHFQYDNFLTGNKNSVGKGIASPKLNINYQLNKNTQLFIKTGMGFHSNDARVVTAQTSNEILPRAYGVDLGVNTKVTDRLFVHAAIWGLDLDQEFVYVGDEGIVEPSGRTRRAGIDLSVRYELARGLFLDGDFNVTRPKARDEAEGQNYIPLAPTFSTIGGISYEMSNGFNTALRYRYIGDRAANEDKSVIAKGYFLADAVLNYRKQKFEIGLSAENLFNIDWNEAQFNTESRLIGETDPVSEIHFTPGTPLFVKMKVAFFF